MVRAYSLALVALVLASSPVSAQTHDWSGFWLGIGAGATRGQFSASDNVCVASATAVGDAAAAAVCSISASAIGTSAAAATGGTPGTASADATGVFPSASASFLGAAAAAFPGSASAAGAGATGAGAAASAGSPLAISQTTVTDGTDFATAFAAGFIGDFNADIRDSFALGVNARYDRQYGNNFIMGLELDSIVSPDTGFSARDTGAGATAWQSATMSSNITSARVRLGFAAGDFLTYVTGGAALGQFKGTLDSRISSGGTTYSSSETEYASAVGGVVGGGVSFWLRDNVVLSTEALYYMFDGNMDFGAATATAGAASAADGLPGSRVIGIGNSATAIMKLSFKLN